MTATEPKHHRVSLQLVKAGSVVPSSLLLCFGRACPELVIIMAEQCIAICDFEAAVEDEMTMARGDLITVCAKGSDSGWWEGTNNRSGKRGLFPNCFVSSNLSPDRPPVFLNKAVALFDYQGREASEMTFKKGDVISVAKPHNSSGWWSGINETAKKARATDEGPKIFSANFVTCNIVLAQFNFKARHSHELSLAIDTVVVVKRKWNDGWWEGVLATDHSTRGLFPSNYTAPNVSTLSPPLFCNKCKAVFTSPTTTTCPECAKNEEVCKTMLRSLEAYSSGLTEKLDLFEHVDVDPVTGRGSLLSEADKKDVDMINRKLAAAAATSK